MPTPIPAPNIIENQANLLNSGVLLSGPRRIFLSSAVKEQAGDHKSRRGEDVPAAEVANGGGLKSHENAARISCDEASTSAPTITFTQPLPTGFAIESGALHALRCHQKTPMD